jgi:hypothetical protein
MYKNAAAFRRLTFMVVILALAALACNFQSADPNEEAPPTSASTSTREVSGKETENESTPGPTNTLRPPETLPANVETEDPPPTDQVEPSSTPVDEPTLAITRTPTSTATRRATVTRNAAQPPPSNSTGPLAFEYTISWRLVDASAKEAIATITITATGGGGGYKYFRDIDEVEATFEYVWATCRGNPTTFRVTSASGESIEQTQFFHPPCPTATPIS